MTNSRKKQIRSSQSHPNSTISPHRETADRPLFTGNIISTSQPVYQILCDQIRIRSVQLRIEPQMAIAIQGALSGGEGNDNRTYRFFGN